MLDCHLVTRHTVQEICANEILCDRAFVRYNPADLKEYAYAYFDASPYDNHLYNMREYYVDWLAERKEGFLGAPVVAADQEHYIDYHVVDEDLMIGVL